MLTNPDLRARLTPTTPVAPVAQAVPEQSKQNWWQSLCGVAQAGWLWVSSKVSQGWATVTGMALDSGTYLVRCAVMGCSQAREMAHTLDLPDHGRGHDLAVADPFAHRPGCGHGRRTGVLLRRPGGGFHGEWAFSTLGEQKN